jgi:hypothetical protein
MVNFKALYRHPERFAAFFDDPPFGFPGNGASHEHERQRFCLASFA